MYLIALLSYKLPKTKSHSSTPKLYSFHNSKLLLSVEGTAKPLDDNVSVFLKWEAFNWCCYSFLTLFFVVQSPSHVRLFATPWTATRQAYLSFIIYQSLLKLMSIESMMPSNYPILCHPFSSCPQPFPASESFPMSRIFISGGQSIGASASAIRCMGRGKICFLTSRPLFFPLLYAQEICKPFKKRNRILHKFVSPVKQII